MAQHGSTTTVTRLLQDRYGLEAKPGHKTTCPKCGHKTLSIKRDDTLVKCFHPSCDFYLRAGGRDNGVLSQLQDMLDNIYEAFHSELLAQKSKPGANAYHYCVTERAIHAQVVADSMLGAVPESGYDVNAQLEPLLQSLHTQVEATAPTSPKPGRPVKNPQLDDLKKQIRVVEDFKSKLENCLKGTQGWLCFFYTDRHHLITSIRFRQPYSKKLLYFKPFDSAGLFGRELFSPYKSEQLQHLNEKLLVVEGEFNQLQLQSLAIRALAEPDELPPYVNCCAVGGVNNADFATIAAVASEPIICYDNDANNAGMELVNNARAQIAVTALTTPYTDSDLDSYIRSFATDYKSAWEAIVVLVKNRCCFYRDYESIAGEIYRIRQKQGPWDKRRDFEINAEVATAIIKDLEQRGKFYNDGKTAYFFFNEHKKLIIVDENDDECMLMLSKYGINGTESVYRYLISDLRIKAKTDGRSTRVYRFTYFHASTSTLYLYNYANQIYRITPDHIDLVDNGTDGVLFRSDPKSEPFKYCDYDKSQSLLDKIIIDKINFDEDSLSVPERKLLFTMWFYSIFFEDIMPTKPILAFIGIKGSGKSMTARRVGQLLFGSTFNVATVNDDVKDFDAAVTNAPYVVIDNADSKSSWLEDRLAIIATGGTITRRELYTTNKLVEFPASCFLAITSRTPKFRRDDVADRLLIMRLKRFDTFVAEKTMLDEVLRFRNQIMSEVIDHLQRVVQALDKYKGSGFSSTFRIADFADFATKVARFAGIEPAMQSIFDKLSHEQSRFTLEGEQIYELLSEWVQDNEYKEVTTDTLCHELSDVAEKQGGVFIYKGKTRSFAQRLGNLRPNLEEFFHITDREGGGHKKLFSFQLKESE